VNGVFVSPTLAAALKHDRAIVAIGLAGVAALSWIYLIYMDWGMRSMDCLCLAKLNPTIQQLAELPIVYRGEDRNGPRRATATGT
jgi:hypothetical protein